MTTERAGSGAARPLLILAVLTLVNAMAQAGGTLLSAVLPLIKAEFGYSDSLLGLLTGYGSAVSYTLMALPISHWALKYGASTVLTLSMLLCGAANALTAVCGAFWQLLGMRFITGTGPAAAWPLGQALVSDHFPPAKRSGAMAAYMAGDFAGSTVPLVVGGWIAVQYGWRTAFVVFGLAIIASALLQRWLVPDQPATAVEPKPVDEPVQVHWADGLRALWRQRSFVHITLGFSWASFAVSGLAQWMPSFYNRQFGLAPDQAAAFFGGAYAGGALLGLVLGGWMGNRIGASHMGRLLGFCMGTYALTFPCILGVLFAPNLQFAFVAHVLATTFGAMPNGPVLSMVHTALPRSLRVLASSVFLLAMTLLGGGGGPLLIGMFSDYLQPQFGHESLKYAMLGVKLLGLLLFVHLTLAWLDTRRRGQQALSMNTPLLTPGDAR